MLKTEIKIKLLCLASGIYSKFLSWKVIISKANSLCILYVRWYIDRTENYFSHTPIRCVLQLSLYIVSTKVCTCRQEDAHCKSYIRLNIVWQNKKKIWLPRNSFNDRSISDFIDPNLPSLARRKKNLRKRKRKGNTKRPRLRHPTAIPARIPMTASNDLQSIKSHNIFPYVD